jgi:hypothetical protein
LLGSDLTDPDNIGDTDGNNYTAAFEASIQPYFSGGGGAFNVFNGQLEGRNNKWCCDPPPVWVSAGNFGLHTDPNDALKYKLTKFTIASSNDYHVRDADKFEIQGSDDNNLWTTIYKYDNAGKSPWTRRNEVLLYELSTHYSVCQPYRYFRYHATSTLFATMVPDAVQQHALNGLEFFGVAICDNDAECSNNDKFCNDNKECEETKASGTGSTCDRDEMCQGFCGGSGNTHGNQNLCIDLKVDGSKCNRSSQCVHVCNNGRCNKNEM